MAKKSVSYYQNSETHWQLLFDFIELPTIANSVTNNLLIFTNCHSPANKKNLQTAIFHLCEAMKTVLTSPTYTQGFFSYATNQSTRKLSEYINDNLIKSFNMEDHEFRKSLIEQFVLSFLQAIAKEISKKIGGDDNVSFSSFESTLKRYLIENSDDTITNLFLKVRNSF